MAAIQELCGLRPNASEDASIPSRLYKAFKKLFCPAHFSKVQYCTAVACVFECMLLKETAGYN